MENELRKYADIVWHWIWLIALGALLAAGAAYATSKLTPPVYEASTTLLINQAPSSAATDSAAILIKNEQLALTYSNMMVEFPVLDEVIGTLGLNLSADQLARMVNVQPVRDTQLVKLSVDSEDPALATRIANAIPAAFSRQNAALQAGRYADSKANLTTDMDNLSRQIEQTQSDIDTIGTPASAKQETDLARLQLELTQLRQSYSSLRQSYENIGLAEAQSTSNIVVTEPARVPALPVRPRTFQNTVLGGVVGLMLALGIVFLIEYLDDRVRSPDQIDRLLHLPVIGLIARVKTNGDDGLSQSALITLHEPRTPVAEAFRSLRTNIQFAGVDHPIRTLVVTSARPTEGKSTVAANLAIVMAQAGRRVALVDADLRRPVIHKVFNHRTQPGLTDLMLQQPDVAEWLTVLQPSAVENLTLITSGPLPPNPSELLGSQRMRQLVERLHGSNDVVILDTPPLLAVTDALVLSPPADGVILVVNAGDTRLGAALQAVTQLAQAGARIVGVVLNNIPTGRRSYYYYQYYQYYHYVPSSENGQREHQPAPATIRPTLLRNPFNEQGEQTAPVPDKATAAERATFARDDKRVT